MQVEEEYGVLDPEVAIESMRANGYLSTDTAIAELIDNAIDAEATTVEVLLYEREHSFKDGRTGRRIAALGVLDDGHGMSSHDLRMALRFGGGRREDRKLIGRFGFGLPNSSISQCNKTTVWSWRNGSTNALRAYLDVAEVRSGTYREVPPPIADPLPDRVASIASSMGRCGTYVEWTELSPGGTWKRGSTVIGHTSELVGRIYRYYLTRHDRPVRILMHIVEPDGSIRRTETVRPNDPLYLMADTSAPWDVEPMFQEFTTQPWTLSDKAGVDQKVIVRISYAKPECRLPIGGQQAGNQPHGKHAHRNQGISIVRNDRELELADVLQFDPFRDRWIGCEIRFPAELDELFGVINNKQGASALTSALRAFGRNQASSVKDMIESEDLDPNEDRVGLYRLAQWVAGELKNVAELVKRQREGSASDDRKRHEESSVEDRATDASKSRSEDHPTAEEQQEDEKPSSPEDQLVSGVKSLTDKGYDPQEAQAIMSVALDKDRKVLFVHSAPSEYGDQIFAIEPQPGARIEVVMNCNHPAYQQLVEILDGSTVGLSADQLQDRIQVASDNLKMLFAAWTRMELEAAPGRERTAIQRVRVDWGRMAADFLDDELIG